VKRHDGIDGNEGNSNDVERYNNQGGKCDANSNSGASDISKRDSKETRGATGQGACFLVVRLLFDSDDSEFSKRASGHRSDPRDLDG
jgi:hypothetical protein